MLSYTQLKEKLKTRVKFLYGTVTIKDLNNKEYIIKYSQGQYFDYLFADLKKRIDIGEKSFMDCASLGYTQFRLDYFKFHQESRSDAIKLKQCFAQEPEIYDSIKKFIG